MTAKDLVLNEIRRVAADQNKALAPLADNLLLSDSGLDSLCFAILVARLEDLTGSDPLGQSQSMLFPRTIGELVALYEQAVV